jgi:uncharacterized protein (TIGR02466 family)
MERVEPFRTPIYLFEPADLAATNEELVTRLVAERDAHPGLVRSNVGGWHSTPDLSQRPDACYRALRGALVEHTGRVMDELDPTRPRSRFGVQAWAMVMRRGDYTTLHDHGEAHWSVVYFADAGEPSGERAGVLAFVDPRRGGRPGGVLRVGTTFEVRPSTGMLVVFPGWLQHFVHGYDGDRPRVSISANITVEPSR